MTFYNIAGCQEQTRKALELKAKVLMWHGFSESAYGRAQANRYSAELLALTGEFYSHGQFITA